MSVFRGVSPHKNGETFLKFRWSYLYSRGQKLPGWERRKFIKDGFCCLVNGLFLISSKIRKHKLQQMKVLNFKPVQRRKIMSAGRAGNISKRKKSTTAWKHHQVWTLTIHLFYPHLPYILLRSWDVGRDKHWSVFQLLHRWGWSKPISTWRRKYVHLPKVSEIRKSIWGNIPMKHWMRPYQRNPWVTKAIRYSGFFGG